MKKSLRQENEAFHYVADIASQLPLNAEASEVISQDQISSIPLERWDVNLSHGSERMDYKFGGFMCNVFMFDYSAFSFAKSEAMATDPQQRLLLKLSASCVQAC